MMSYPVQMDAGMNVPVKRGDSTLNGSRDIRQRTRRRRHFRPFLDKTPNGVLPYCHRVRRPAASSFVTK